MGQVDRPLGDQPFPMAYQDLKRKFSGLTSAIFPGGADAHAMDLFLDLEAIPKAGGLTSGLRALSSREAIKT